MQPQSRTLTSSIRRDFPFSDDEFRRVCRFIYRRAGISIGPHKKEMVYSRLARVLRSRRLTSFTTYMDMVEAGGSDDLQEFVNALTTNLTSFFRESHHFPILAEKMKAAARHGTVYIWTCASSTGEEAWSLAMTAVETFGTNDPPVKILATDIDTAVLEKGRKGIYSDRAVEQLTQAQLKKFFHRGVGTNAGLVRVRPELQRLVTFAPLNLLAEDWGPLEIFDAIFCRNVMIYFDHDTQRRVLRRFAPRLRKDGLLFAGHSESFYHSTDIFRTCGKTVYRKV